MNERQSDKDDAVALAHRWIRGEVLSRPQFDQVASELIRLNHIAPLPELQRRPQKATALCDLMRQHAEYMATYSEPFVGSTAAIADYLTKGADYINQLERELFVSQNDLGRFEESNRTAQETIADLREQLALAQKAARIFERGHAAAEEEINDLVSTSGALPEEPTWDMIDALRTYSPDLSPVDEAIARYKALRAVALSARQERKD